MAGEPFKVIYHGASDPLVFIDGETYDVVDIDEDTGMYYVVDETGEDYMYSPEFFEAVNEEKSA